MLDLWIHTRIAGTTSMRKIRKIKSMKEYKIKRIVEVNFWFTVEADSEDEAIEHVMCLGLEESIKKCYDHSEDTRHIEIQD